ncbi:MerR family transcriptional regulator [Streptomyces sp. NPDC086091]|uniref:DNA polymerase III subunit beta family protein n=1 Tax=Streptomyces sp. NPDC086091 TaxID=3365751 RepID=UPI0038028288
MRGIGEMARDSGLGISALRFYDRSGVLVPARVDPVSGYRRYSAAQVEEARVLALLRRAGMPLADVRLVLAGWSGADTAMVRQLLQAHLRRLADGLTEARDAFSTVRSLLDDRENPMTSPRTTPVRTVVAAPELAVALDAVRFAAGSDPALPALGGVLLDFEDDALHLVATDRYRMAVARAVTSGHDGGRVQAVVPAPLVDAMRALLGGGGTAALSLDGDLVTLECAGRRTEGQCLGHDFPDYRRLVRLPAGRRVLVDVRAFDAALRHGPVCQADASPSGEDLSVLSVTADGTPVICEEGEEDEAGGGGGAPVALNRTYLLQALDALAGRDGDHGRLVLELGDPTAPVTLRRPDTDHPYSLLMPVRLDS